MNNIFIGDTETTSLEPDNRIVEIGWIQIDEEVGILDTFEALVNPEQPISQDATDSHGITDEMVADKPTIKELFGTVVECSQFLKQGILIAHNAKFDMRVWPKIMNIQRSICTLRAARKLYPDAPNHQLQTLRYHLNLEVESPEDIIPHRALSDVYVLLALLKQEIVDSGKKTITEFADWVDEPIVYTHMPWGKHKGVALEHVPRGYLWFALYKMENLDEDLKDCLKKVFFKD